MSTGLRGRSWTRFLKGPDQALLESLYVPALAEAVRYDRCCAYFSSSVLAAAARGFGGLIERLLTMGDAAPRPAVRLLVNEELQEDDITALTEAADFSGLETALKKRFKAPKDLLEKRRLQMLGWLAKAGFLEVRVGVMRHGGGIVHAKFGIATDPSSEAIVFAGSGNETAQGLLGNYEQLEISSSWGDPERFDEFRNEFDALWNDRHSTVHTVPLPEALRLQLIRLAPKEPPIVEPSNAVSRQRAAMVWQYVTEAPFFLDGGATSDATAMVDPWPHQRRVVEETADAWPDGRLLCDEVGMGKTIEAILILKRLMAGRGVRRALILLPAGLLKQWQGELREKGGLVIPRLEGASNLVWPDDSVEKLGSLAEALGRDVLLMSRETARTEANLAVVLTAEPWDLVLLDESHAARRRKQEEGDFNSGTLLLNLLRRLQLTGRTRGILLLSATPMQTHPWEPWDLLQVLGEGGAWLSEFSRVRDFYAAMASVKERRCDAETARRAAALIVADERFPESPQQLHLPMVQAAIASKLAFPLPTQRDLLAGWMRCGSPLSRRMHRNTRQTLRKYYELGLLSDPPTVRVPDDISYDFKDQAERNVYNSVGAYIERRFKELEHEKPGKGFVMTIYRRRASSSPLALERSLGRRADGLRRVASQMIPDLNLTSSEELDARDLDDLGDFDSAGPLSSALPSDPATAKRELIEVEKVLDDLRGLAGRDSKRDAFFEVLRKATEDGRPVLVFTEYTDTMEYLRDLLVDFYGKGLGCYSGDGGQLRDGLKWKIVTKDAITRALRAGELRALICTDAASEGLNLQAAGALINFDLPWNPSKVEQRIGRIDRIGQKYPQIRIINLFLRNSIDEQVYRVLQARCRLFEHFVGAMQPVLARARKMLLGQEKVDLDSLVDASAAVSADPLADGTYFESFAVAPETSIPAYGRSDLLVLLSELDAGIGPQVRVDPKRGTARLRATGIGDITFSVQVETLEADRTVQPLSPTNPAVRKLASLLRRPGERLPLVIGAAEKGGFRCSAAYWVGSGGTLEIKSLGDLRNRLDTWDGTVPDSETWVAAHEQARQAAQKIIDGRELRAAEKESKALALQLGAARQRLHRELGRYLVCLDASTSGLNEVLSHQINRDIESARWLKEALKRLGGTYPDWSSDLQKDLDAFRESLKENQRKARLTGREILAALDDPRWMAAEPVRAELVSSAG